MKKKVLVLGGGISGLSVAWKLAERGIAVDVIEAKNYVGGLAATIRVNNYNMDFGPHSFFSEDKEILRMLMGLFNNDVLEGTRNVRLFMNGKYLRYPLKAEDIFLKLGIWPSAKCFLSLIEEKLRREPSYGVAGPNMEQWSIRYFGRALHELFFRPYTEQFWNVPCHKLSPDCIPTYKQMSFFKTLKLLLTSQKRRKYLSMIDRETLPYFYPKGGFGSIVEEITKKITLAKGKVRLGLKANEVRKTSKGGFIVETKDKKNKIKKFETDFVVSTIPIPDFARILTPEIPSNVKKAAQELKYLSLVVLYLTTKRTNILDCMYEYSLEKPYIRISDLNNTTLVPPGGRNGNMLSIEKTCHFGDKWWRKSKEDLFETFIPHLEKDGILKKSEVTDLYLLKASHVYPMYLYNYKKPLNIFRNYIDTIPNLKICGRTGLFKYMDIDQCMRTAFNVADELIKALS